MCDDGTCSGRLPDATTLCRSGGGCDAPEYCDGAGACDPDGHQPAGFVCLESTDPCVPRDVCDDSGACLDGGYLRDGVACSGGICVSGACERGGAVCGNGVIEGDEACDDGSESAMCDADCTPVACGDGLGNATAGEACETTSSGSCPSCSGDCGTLTRPEGLHGWVDGDWSGLGGCMLDAGGTVRCAGGPSPPTDVQPPAGARIIDITLGVGWMCGIREGDHDAACWSSDSGWSSMPPTPPAGVSFQSIEAGSGHACGLVGDPTAPSPGQVRCFGADGATFPAPTGNFTEIASGFRYSCGVRAPDGGGATPLHCWGLDGWAPEVPAGNFVQVSANGDYTCAINTAGQIVCFGASISEWAPPTWAIGFSDVAVGSSQVCAVQNGTGRCWSRDGSTQTLPGVTNVLRTGTVLGGGGPYGCHLRADGVPVCNGPGTELPDLPDCRPWSYDGATGTLGPADWEDLWPECGGDRQSPIDISFGDLVFGPIEDPEFVSSPSVTSLVNTGHSMEWPMEWASTPSSFTLDSKEYVLQTVELHTPSEHTVQAVSQVAEAHLVHRASDGSVAVIAVFFIVGEETSATLDQMAISDLPDSEGKSHRPTGGGTWNPCDLLRPQLPGYFGARWTGSLTAPPCTEDVLWLVSLTPHELTAGQAALLSEHCPNNNRSVQPVNGRVLLHDQAE